MCQQDSKCVARVLEGHPDAFRHLVMRYEEKLLSYLSARLGDIERAEETAQEAFVRAYFSLRKLRKADSFFPWLVGIADRVAKENRRAEERVRPLLSESVPERTLAEDPREPDIRGAVDSLSGVYREVILLRYNAGMSCAEVSCRLGVPLGTVTKRLSRAYAMLRKRLAREREDREVRQ